MQKRPYVICHMSPSIDGKIVSKNWPSLKIAYATYERTATTLDADAWIVGRVSMAPYAGKSRVRRLTGKQRMPRRDFIAEAKARSYAIAIDPSGKLTWQSNAIDDAHVITVLGEGVSDDYLAFLQSRVPRRGWRHRYADIVRRDGGEGVGAETPVDLDLKDQGRSGLAEIQDVNRRRAVTG
jgi:riboflavin biosynthesis pyrimidine reductase